MNDTQAPALDAAAFQRVWRRVMPQDRPDCPIALNTPEEPAPAPPAPALVRAPAAQRSVPPVCLGEESAGELPALDGLLALTWEGQRAYRALSRRSRRASLASTLAAAKAQQARRLAAARFLITGEPVLPPAGPAPQRRPLPQAVRERYQAEQRGALALLSAANAAADPCLIDLYRAIAMEDQTHAAQLRDWLERM